MESSRLLSVLTLGFTLCLSYVPAFSTPSQLEESIEHSQNTTTDGEYEMVSNEGSPVKQESVNNEKIIKELSDQQKLNEQRIKGLLDEQRSFELKDAERLKQTKQEMNVINQAVEYLQKQIDALKDKQALDQKSLAELKAKQQGYVKAVVAGEHLPFWRLSPNQLGVVSDGKLEGFTINPNLSVQFEIYKTIHSDVFWENRDLEEREILTAMGRKGQRYFAPSPFHVVRMTWSGADANSASGSAKYWAFYSFVNYHNWVTHASYAKRIRGEIESMYFEGITNQWKLCGISQSLTANSYTHPHPYLKSESGEVLFTMLGTVIGKFPLDPENPQWGYLPRIAVVEN